MSALFETLVGLEENHAFHIARLLLLMRAYSGATSSKPINGLMKLAKLDFLLRYPAYLERALTAKGRNPDIAKVRSFERASVETAMVRFKYGPWDFRYRQLINEAIGMGLVTTWTHGSTVNFDLTELGRATAETLGQDEAWKEVADRAQVVTRNFDMSGTNLKEFIYRTFPEILDLRYGSDIR